MGWIGELGGDRGRHGNHPFVRYTLAMSIDEFRQPEWDSATSKVVDLPTVITEPPGNRLWRGLSVLGVIIALVIAAFQSFPLEPRQGRGFLVAAVIAVAAIVVLRRCGWSD